MNGEPGAAVLSIFAQLTDRIKQRIPVDKDGKPIGAMVYSHLVLGMPISKADYFRPWTPAGLPTRTRSRSGRCDWLRPSSTPALAATS